jgi:hypothetical protein
MGKQKSGQVDRFVIPVFQYSGNEPRPLKTTQHKMPGSATP